MNFLYQCWILPVSGLFYILFVISIFSYQNCYRTHNYIFNFSHHNFWIHFIFSYFKIFKHQIINKVKRQASKFHFSFPIFDHREWVWSTFLRRWFINFIIPELLYRFIVACVISSSEVILVQDCWSQVWYIIFGSPTRVTSFPWTCTRVNFLVLIHI